MVVERERLHLLAMEGLDLLQQLYLQQDNLPSAIDVLNRQLTLDPLHEQTVQNLMRAYFKSGQRSEALGVYERYAELLDKELGVLPEDETIELQQQILTGELESASTIPKVAQPVGGRQHGRTSHNIPIIETSFLGRENELALIHKRFDDDPAGCRLQTIVGTGGIGKTRLSMQVGRERESWYEDGVYYFALDSLEQAELLSSEMLDGLGLERHDQIPPNRQLVSHLQRRHMLIILDNFEQLLDESQTDAMQAVGLLIEIMQRAPDIQLLVTSRERLNMQGEWLVELNGLPYPATFEGRRSGNYAAVELFKQRASQILPDFYWHDAASDAVIRICQTVDGHPLALEMAASQLRSKTIFQISDGLRWSSADLSRKTRGVAARHQSMMAVFDHSWRLLAREEQIAFAKLSILRRAWAELTGMFLAEAQAEILERLADQSMIRPVATKAGPNAQPIYEIHPLLRQFARSKLTDLLEHEQIMQLHRRAADYLEGSTTAGVATRQSEIAHHLYHSLIISNAHGDRDQVAETASLDEKRRAASYLLQDGQRVLSTHFVSEAYILFSRCSFICHDASPELNELHLKALFNKARVERLLGETDQAIATYQEGMDLLDELPTNKEQLLTQSSFLIEMAFLHGQKSEKQQGLILIDRAYAILKKVDDSSVQAKKLVAKSLVQKGIILIWDGQFQEAEEVIREAIAQAELIGDDEILARAWNDLGNALRSQERFSEALKAFQNSLSLWEDQKNDYRVAIIENNVAIILAIRDDWAKALTYFQRTLWFWERVEDLEQIARVSVNMGNLLLSLGQWEKSEKSFLQSIDLSKHTGNLRRYSLAHFNLAYLYLEMEKFKQAKEYFLISLKFEEAENSHWLPLVYIGLAEVYVGLTDLTTAQDFATKALNLLEERPQQIELGMVNRTVGKILDYQNNASDKKIEEVFAKSLICLEKAGNRYERARTLAQLAVYHQRKGNRPNVTKYFEMAMMEFVSLGAKKDVERLVATIKN